MHLTVYSHKSYLPSIPDEKAEHALATARQFKQQGCYEEARETIADYWQDIGSRYNIDSLSEPVRARMLLMIGSLTCALGTQRRMKGAQRIARETLRLSIQLATKVNDPDLVAAGLCEVGYTFYRDGKLDSARVILRKAEQIEGLVEGETLAFIRYRQACVEHLLGNLDEAYSILTQNARLFDIHVSGNENLIGGFHNLLAIVLLGLSTTTSESTFIDRAFIEYYAAQYHFQRAGHTRFEAAALNNIGFILFTQGKFDEAHDYLDRARTIFIAVDDAARVAQVDETRARVYTAQGDLEKAVTLINAAVASLRTTEERMLLREAIEEQAKIIKLAVEKSIRVPKFCHLSSADNMRNTAQKKEEDVFTLEMADGDESLADAGIQPGDIIPFLSTSTADPGRFVAAFHMRKQTYLMGFYYPGVEPPPESGYEFDDEVTMFRYANDEYDPDYFLPHEITIIGIHPTLRH
jgi:tetratricopeptide (TPR) repeat protein